MKKKIIVAVDPGYDAIKMIVNEHSYQIRNSIVELGSYENLGSSMEDTVISEFKKGTRHCIGEVARQKEFENKEYRKITKDKEAIDLSLTERFVSDEFQTLIFSAIGYALIRYSKDNGFGFDIDKYSAYKRNDPNRDTSLDDEFSKIEFILGIALPQDKNKELSPKVKPQFFGLQDFDVETDSGKHHLTFEFKENSKAKKYVYTQSQVQAALLNVMLNKDGSPNGDADEWQKKNTPAVIIDAGFRTVGIFELTRTGDIINSESNTDYAMWNIDHAVVDELISEENEYHLTRDDVYEDAIELSLRLDEPISYFKVVDGVKKRFNAPIKDIRDEKIKESCKGLLDYLLGKFDDFRKTKHIYVTGGTGKIYFKEFETYIKRGYPGLEIDLIENNVGKENQTSTFGIVSGLYKVLNRLTTEEK